MSLTKTLLKLRNPAIMARNQELIRVLIEAVNELYGLKEKPQTAGAFDMGRQGRSTNE